MSVIKLYKGDCLVESDKIEDGSVDLILTDLPYGTVKDIKNVDHGMSGKCDWDNVIDTSRIMAIANRVLRKNGKMILFAQDPFSIELKNEAIWELPYTYSMIWEKDHFANALTAKKAPLNYYEDILVFSKAYSNEKSCTQTYFDRELESSKLTSGYFKQSLSADKVGHVFTKANRFVFPTEETYRVLQKEGRGYFCKSYEELKKQNDAIKEKSPSVFNLWEGKKYKSNILNYKKDYNGYHPTQKPVLLLEDIIKTFSNEGDLVVDLTMGSGSTGVACVNTNRDFTGIELGDNFFDIACTRIYKDSDNTIIEKEDTKESTLEEYI